MLLFLAVSAPAVAAILPQRLGDFYQTKTQEFMPLEEEVYREYGFDAAEKSQYAAGDRKLEITALRAKDSTGAYAMFQWLRPHDAKRLAMGELGAESGDTTLFLFGNYVLILRGAMPEIDHLQAMLSVLPRFERGALPPLAQYLPAEGRIRNSERYVLGPVVLEKLAPDVPPSVAALHFGAEAQTADYSAAGGRLTLALFSYPTPQLARAQLEEFQKLPNVLAKRSGPLIAVVLRPFSRDEAEKLLARVRYQATLTLNERPSLRNNVANLILNILKLIAIIVGFMLMGGLAMWGARTVLARLLPGSRLHSAGNEIIRLRLEGK